jgi:hypothetical protein
MPFHHAIVTGLQQLHAASRNTQTRWGQISAALRSDRRVGQIKTPPDPATQTPGPLQLAEIMHCRRSGTMASLVHTEQVTALPHTSPNVAFLDPRTDLDLATCSQWPMTGDWPGSHLRLACRHGAQPWSVSLVVASFSPDIMAMNWRARATEHATTGRPRPHTPATPTRTTTNRPQDPTGTVAAAAAEQKCWSSP